MMYAIIVYVDASVVPFCNGSSTSDSAEAKTRRSAPKRLSNH